MKEQTLFDKFEKIKSKDKATGKPYHYRIELYKDGDFLSYKLNTITGLTECLKFALRQHTIDIKIFMIFKPYKSSNEYLEQSILIYNYINNYFYMYEVGNFRYCNQANFIKEVCTNVVIRYIDKYITGVYYL